MRVLHGLRSPPRSVAFSPDGATLAAGGERGVQAWGLATGRRTGRWGSDAVRTVAFLADGLLAAETRWLVYRLALGDEPRPVAMRPRHGWRAAPSPDGQSLAVAFESSLARWSGDPDWGERPWHTRFTVEGPHGHPASVAWSADGSLLAVGLQNGQVKRFDAATGAEQPALGDGGPTVNAVALSPDGRAVAWCAATHLHFRRDGCAVHHALTKTHFLGVAWHPSGAFFATANGDGGVHYWDALRAERVESFAWGVGKLNALAFDAAGDRAACGSERGEVVVWDVDR